MKSHNTIVSFINHLLLSLFLLAMTGCASQKTWVYRSNTFAPPGGNTAKKIAVLPFEDLRENSNQNLAGLCFIPLVPYGPQNLNSPEGLAMHTTSAMWLNYKPTEDYAKALAEDLRGTRLFADAFFDYRREAGDYAVKGRIIDTKYTGRTITYCISFFGAYLWFVGFPCAWTENNLSLEMTLVDSKTDKVLFTKNYTAQPRSGWSWIYCMKNDFNYPEMLAELNKEFCTDIQPVVIQDSRKASAPPAQQ